MTVNRNETHFTPVGAVRLRTSDGDVHTLIHGDVIGRLWSAALHVNDGRVSECHAMVSIRGSDLQLVGLRGRFRVDGEVRREVVLEVGQRIELAPGVVLTVATVIRPHEVLALECPGMPRRVVSGVLSLYGGDQVGVRPGWVQDTEHHLWPTGDGWMRSDTAGPVEVTDGTTWDVDGVSFRAVVLASGVAPTEDDHLSGGLKIVARYDAVHLHQLPSGGVVVLSGLSARLVTELVTLAQPIEWHVLAADLWGPLPKDMLRKRWDMQVSRLRRKFRATGIRQNLVLADGTGLVQLVLGPGDTVVDES